MAKGRKVDMGFHALWRGTVTTAYRQLHNDIIDFDYIIR